MTRRVLEIAVYGPPITADEMVAAISGAVSALLSDSDDGPMVEVHRVAENEATEATTRSGRGNQAVDVVRYIGDLEA